VSGIYGMVRYDSAPVTPETLGPMAAAMSFWGPDGHGQWCGDGVGLGHLMLHVTPESLHERLPASIRVAPHLVITADARIDNRDELFDALGAPAAGRACTPDSSLILLAYERWGADCVKRLLGDFAFAVWDGRERKLFCARDPFGCMPFVYYYDGKRFIFASDIKGVLARMESPKLNEAMIAAYLQMSTYHAEKRLTFFEEIVKLEAAHTLTLSAGGLSLARYWSPEESPEVRFVSDADYAAQMRHLFTESVRCRLRSAFPVGSHLSGGLDSSSVSVVAAQLLRAQRQQLTVFSWSPPPEPGVKADPADEHGRIEAVCRQEHLTCQYLPPTKESYFESFRRDFTVEPGAMLALEGKVQARAASQGLRVVLSGWGGDEVVTAHSTSYLAEFLLNNQWSEFGNAVRVRLESPRDGSSLRKALRGARRLGGIFRELATLSAPDALFAVIHTRPYLEFESSCIQSAFGRQYQTEVKRLRGPIWRQLPHVRATMARHLRIGYTTLRLEHWTGSGAHHNLVYRYPMLDRRLVEFVFGVPTAQFCGPGRTRTLFRRAFSDLMPAADWAVAKKQPRGREFLRKVYVQAHAEWARHLLRDGGDSSASRYVDPAKLERATGNASEQRRIGALSGVREAFGCYAIRKMH
jgi:asparagine synthase (glutamine-hydrolysing)